MSVCVVGAGINGLSTAVQLQRLEPRASYTLISSEFSPNTTGDVSAGYWRPFYLADPRECLLKRWAAATFQHMETLCNADPVRFGAGRTSAWELFHAKQEAPFWADIVHGFQLVSGHSLLKQGWSDYSHAYFYTTYWLESTRYLPVLQQEFEQNGGTVIKQCLKSFDEIKAKHDVIINCTGIGARDLANDDSVYPIRGQIYRVYCPGFKYALCADDHYILPNHDGIYVLGGTHTENDWNTSINPKDSQFIWNGCVNLAPIFKDAKIISQQVGLRPGRPKIRLECEIRNIQGHEVPIVHNYGHGGSGITLHWGCASDAAALAKEALHKSSNVKKLAKL